MDQPCRYVSDLDLWIVYHQAGNCRKNYFHFHLFFSAMMCYLKIQPTDNDLCGTIFLAKRWVTTYTDSLLCSLPTQHFRLPHTNFPPLSQTTLGPPIFPVNLSSSIWVSVMFSRVREPKLPVMAAAFPRNEFFFSFTKGVFYNHHETSFFCGHEMRFFSYWETSCHKTGVFSCWESSRHETIFFCCETNCHKTSFYNSQETSYDFPPRNG